MLLPSFLVSITRKSLLWFLSDLISPSSCRAPLRPPPSAAPGRRGGTGACDWPLRYTACREPARAKGRCMWVVTDEGFQLVKITWENVVAGIQTEQFWEQHSWEMVTKIGSNVISASTVSYLYESTNVRACPCSPKSCSLYSRLCDYFHLDCSAYLICASLRRQRRERLAHY